MSSAFTKNGVYSVKTTYMIGKSCNFDNLPNSWVLLWGLNVSPKVRHFLWRVCSGTLPVRSLLKYRHLTNDDTCRLCKNHVETTSHLLFECEAAKEVMVLGGFEELIPSESVTWFLELFESWDSTNVEEVLWAAKRRAEHGGLRRLPKEKLYASR